MGKSSKRFKVSICKGRIQPINIKCCGYCCFPPHYAVVCCSISTTLLPMLFAVLSFTWPLFYGASSQRSVYTCFLRITAASTNPHFLLCGLYEPRRPLRTPFSYCGLYEPRWPLRTTFFFLLMGLPPNGLSPVHTYIHTYIHSLFDGASSQWSSPALSRLFMDLVQRSFTG